MQNTYKGNKIVKISKIVLLVILIIFALQIPQLIRSERLTDEVGYKFEYPANDLDYGWNHQIKDLKVLSYSPTEAKVYYICGNYLEGPKYEYGVIALFEGWAGKNWLMKSFKYKWVKSTDVFENIVMPYWWHNIPG